MYCTTLSVLYCNILLYSRYFSLSMLGPFLGDTAGLFYYCHCFNTPHSRLIESVTDLFYFLSLLNTVTAFVTTNCHCTISLCKFTVLLYQSLHALCSIQSFIETWAFPWTTAVGLSHWLCDCTLLCTISEASS